MEITMTEFERLIFAIEQGNDSLERVANDLDEVLQHLRLLAAIAANSPVPASPSADTEQTS